MESLENESHLCVQFPHMYQRCKDQSDICQGNVTGGQGQMIEGQCQAVECQSGVGSLCIECQRTGCLQQNLKLGNGTLVVHEEAFIDKDIWNTTLHLRVFVNTFYHFHPIFSYFFLFIILNTGYIFIVCMHACMHVCVLGLVGRCVHGQKSGQIKKQNQTINNSKNKKKTDECWHLFDVHLFLLSKSQNELCFH